MYKRIFSLLSGVILAGSVSKTMAQVDPHFTQYYIYPLYINPAMTGGSDGEYRISGIFRNQWGSISNPYQTVGASFDKRTQKNMAFGFNLLNQSAGNAGFNYLNAYATAAYTGVKFGPNDNHRVSIALQAGFINRRVDQTKFQTGEQWNPITGYNPQAATGENLAASQSTVLDIGAGALYYDATPNRKANVYAGASVFHLNRPKDPFVTKGTVALMQIPIRYAVHGGVSYNISERTRIVPNAMFMQQGTAKELMFGTYVQINVNPETDFMFGGYYRVKDAAAPFVGVDWKDFLIGLSYDVNASKLGAWNRNVNAFELSLSYSKRRPGQSIVDFIRCPRL